MRKIIKNKNRIIASLLLNSVVFLLVFGLSFFDKYTASSTPYDQLAPRTPQGLAVQVSNRSAEVTWYSNKEEDLFSYALYIRTADGIEDEDKVMVGDNNSYKLERLSEKETYYISLAALDKEKNESERTPEIGFTPDKDFIKDFRVSGWIQASADVEEARRAYENNIEVFTSISPFWFSAQADGSIEKRGEIMNEEMYVSSKENGVKVIPTITNNFDEDSKISNLLEDSELTRSHIDTIMQLVTGNGFDGIDIDYENLDSGVKREFTAFMEELGNRLHDEGKLLSVAVQAKKSDTNTWSGAGAMDFDKLGDFVDQFRVMTYDFSRVNTAPGPIAPIYWMQEVLEYTMSKVPKEKIMAGIPFYAYRWCTSRSDDECSNKGLTWEGVENIIEDYDPVEEWDDRAETPWFMYVDDDNNSQIVYYENHESIEKKLEMVRELGIGGIAIWRLGSEDPQNYSVIKDKLGKKIKPPTGLKVEPGDEAIRVSWHKVEDETIKGYRVFIKSKISNELLLEEKDIDQNDDDEEVIIDPDDITLEDILEKYKYDSSFVDDGWDEEYVDIFDENEYTFENLDNDRVYQISIMSQPWKFDFEEYDMDKNEEETRTTAPAYITPKDLKEPSTIDDLEIKNIGNSEVDLVWTAQGDNAFEGQAAAYEVRYSEEEITENNFHEAIAYEHTPVPNDPKDAQEWQIRGLEPGGKYYFAVKTLDEAGNISDISNVVEAETEDNLAPMVPQGIAITSLDEEIFVKWNSNEEKDLMGYKLFYKQGNSYYKIVEINKENTHYSIRDLDNGSEYFVGLSAIDVRGNESPKSDDVSAIPGTQSQLGKFKGFLNKSAEKLKGAVSVFAEKIFTPKAIPFIVVLSVLVVNYLIFHGIKREIHKKPKKEIPNSVNTKPGRVVDLKNIRRTLR